MDEYINSVHLRDICASFSMDCESRRRKSIVSEWKSFPNSTIDFKIRWIINFFQPIKVSQRTPYPVKSSRSIKKEKTFKVTSPIVSVDLAHTFTRNRSRTILSSQRIPFWIPNAAREKIPNLKQNFQLKFASVAFKWVKFYGIFKKMRRNYPPPRRDEKISTKFRGSCFQNAVKLTPCFVPTAYFSDPFSHYLLRNKVWKIYQNFFSKFYIMRKFWAEFSYPGSPYSHCHKFVQSCTRFWQHRATIFAQKYPSARVNESLNRSAKRIVLSLPEIGVVDDDRDLESGGGAAVSIFSLQPLLRPLSVNA